MPLVTISVHAGQLEDAQKARLISLVTDAVAEGEGFRSASRASTSVLIDEVPAGSFYLVVRHVRLDDFLDLLHHRQAHG